MKQRSYLCPAAFLLLISSCGPIGNNDAEVARQIVDGTRQLCSFVPLTTSILAILGTPGAPAAGGVADAICAEVLRATDAGFVAPGTTLTLDVFDVPVTGELVA